VSLLISCSGVSDGVVERGVAALLTSGFRSQIGLGVRFVIGISIELNGGAEKVWSGQ